MREDSIRIHVQVRAELALLQLRCLRDYMHLIQQGAPQRECDIELRAMEAATEAAANWDALRRELGLMPASQVVQIEVITAAVCDHCEDRRKREAFVNDCNAD